MRAALEEAKQSGGTQATAVKRLREAHHSSLSQVVVHVAELDEPEEEPDDGSPSWSPPEEFEVVVRKDRKHGLGIELSRDCRVIGFHGRGAQDAGVPHGAQLLSVAGINLRGVPSIADASEKEEQMDRLMQSAGRRTAVGDNVTLRLRTVPSSPSSRSSPSPIGRRSRSRSRSPGTPSRAVGRTPEFTWSRPRPPTAAAAALADSTDDESDSTEDEDTSAARPWLVSAGSPSPPKKTPRSPQKGTWQSGGSGSGGKRRSSGEKGRGKRGPVKPPVVPRQGKRP